MNRGQIVALWMTGLTIAAMCLCPPWLATAKVKTVSAQKFAGYAPIWTADHEILANVTLKPFTPEFWGIEIAVSRLAVQCLAGLVIGGSFYFSFNRPKQMRKKEPRNSEFPGFGGP